MFEAWLEQFFVQNNYIYLLKITYQKGACPIDRRYWQKSGQIEVSERFFEKISRNMTDTEKMMLTNIIGNFVADNIVFEVSKIGPLDPEIWAKKVVKRTETRIS